MTRMKHRDGDGAGDDPLRTITDREEIIINQDHRSAIMELASLGFGSSFLSWVSSIAAIYLLVLDRTNWRTKILTELLVPYIFFSLPNLLFDVFRGEVGKWISLIAIILRLFFPRRFPDWLEMPAALILLMVVAPDFFADAIRENWAGALICFVIACYLLPEHIRASGGFRDSFTQPHGISNTIGILLLLVYPVWVLVIHFALASSASAI